MPTRDRRAEQLDPADVARDMRQSCDDYILRGSTVGESHTRLVNAIRDMLQDEKVCLAIVHARVWAAHVPDMWRRVNGR